MRTTVIVDGREYDVVTDGSKSPEETVREGMLPTIPALAERRRAAYPSVEDQLDYIYHNGLEAWKTNIIAPIKAEIQ